MFAVSLGDPTSGNSRGSQRTPEIMVGSQPDGIATVSAGLLRYKGVQCVQAYSDTKVYNSVSSGRPQLLKRWITLSARYISIHWIVIHPVDSTIQCLNNWGQIRAGAEGSRMFLESDIIFHLKEVSSIATWAGFVGILLKLSLPNIFLC